MNIASIMSTIIPGTFVPDMNAGEKPTVSPIPALGNVLGSAAAAAGNAASDAVSAVSGPTSFKDTVKQLMADVNDKINTSDKNTRDLATGKTHDLNKVVTSVEEANLALQYTMAIRTKLLDAYSEISRMSV